MSEVNPYRPPRSRVADVASAAARVDSFIEGGRSVPTSQGWAWIVEGFAMFKRKPWIWIAMMIILFVILIALSLVPALGSLANIALMPVFTGGIMLGCLALKRDGALEIGHLFAGFKSHAGSLVVLGLLSIAALMVVMVPGVMIMGGSAFFAVMRGDPASISAMGSTMAVALLVLMGLSIPIYMALWFAPALVTLRDISPIDALKQSFRGCLNNIMPFLIYGIALLILGVIAVIPIGLGLLILVPTVMGSIYAAYQNIFFER
jgi:uncharacterized membrane protein